MRISGIAKRYNNKQLFLIIVAGIATIFSIFQVDSDIQGKVIKVADGDTITILTQDKQQIMVRLGNIDAPEKRQDYGQASTNSLNDMCYGVNAIVKVKDEDRYGRKVGVVFCNGVEANLRQVELGLAWVYRQYSKDSRYYSAEKEARENRFGLWAKLNPTPPWEFRKK